VTFRIVLLPGDGIGPEVTAAAVLVLRAAARRFAIDLSFEEFTIGARALRAGDPPLPGATLAACLAADAVLLGAVGDPEFDRAPRDRRPETGLLQLRRALDVYANLRPAVVFSAVAGTGPFRSEAIAGTDLLIVRELSSGLYYGEPRGVDASGRFAVNTLRYTTDEIARVARVAFESARGRRRHVTSVDKANVLETSQLWRATVERVGAEYPDVQLDHLYVDACSMLLILDSTRFDVIVTENLFGDILSDEAGALVGSLGLLPSASLGRGTGLYEPVHGSAPALAGQDVANPIGAIASAAMLLRHSLRREDASAAIDAAIVSALQAGLRTRDIAEPGAATVGCSVMAHAIAERIEAV
jgi:3-isopropylmalate dehydrogenase